MIKSIPTPSGGAVQHYRWRSFQMVAAIGMLLGACAEPTRSVTPAAPRMQGAVKFWEAGSSVAWNETARNLIVSRGVTSPIAQSRILTYLSVAQYNAVIAAEDGSDGRSHPSPAAAAAGASLIVLSSFFPLDIGLLNGQLADQSAATPWSGETRTDFSAGEAIGRGVGAQVVAYAISDNTNLTAPPANPGLAGNWTGTNSIRGLYGTRPFTLTSGDQFRPAPPPVYNSPEFITALEEIRALSVGLTADQLTLAQTWAPRGPAYLNGVGSDAIVAHHRSEREAARILAASNMAGFDALVGCFDAKFAYWYIRPSQVPVPSGTPAINLPIGLPNHPSYPSGHSCITAAYATVFAAVFPEEAERFATMVRDAGLSRNYAGLHYFFDCTAGQELGRNVANYVMSVWPAGHSPIPLD
jgi:hypothetical protein